MLDFAATVVLQIITLFGHLGIWIAYYNQMNAMNLPRLSKKLLEKVILVGFVVIGMTLVATWYNIAWLDRFNATGSAANLLGGYSLICWGFALFVSLRWFWWLSFRPQVIRDRDVVSTTHDLQEQLGFNPSVDAMTRLFSNLPLNEIYQVDINEKELFLDELPPALSGLSVLHLSDIHMTGYIQREWYEAAIRLACERKPDLVLITGDIVDHTRCLDWLEPVFSKLKSRYGAYYVLGNHDKRVKDEADLRKRLKRAGLKSVNGKWSPVSIGDHRLWLTGNELPWYRGAESVEPNPPSFDASRDFKIVLSHSPDQMSWARRRGISLMLAGHNHGGQIRIPFIGPLVTPSRYGVKYASGTFRESPTTLHVSRGLSGVHPIRWNCKPEVTILRLRSSVSASSEKSESNAKELNVERKTAGHSSSPDASPNVSTSQSGAA